MHIIDLRSDTVTKPTPEMREAMAEAIVGDDVYQDDPTVNRLQDMAAHITGKEAALFVPSGTMGNLIAVLAHCGRGDEVIIGNLSHTFLYEVGGISALGSVHSAQIPNQLDGSFNLKDLQSAIRVEDIHAPVTKLICIENTHNRRGGIALEQSFINQVGNIAAEHHISLHMDGARLFNASVDQYTPPEEICAPVDSVTFCLSKALCAPVGSVLCGTHEFINKARHIRKQLGGGMRQAGILAAAGIVALEQMVDRLAEDHQKVKRLATALEKMDAIHINSAYTNMLYFTLEETHPLSAKALVEILREKGILVNVLGENSIRIIPHYWVTDADIDYVLDVIESELK